MYKAIDQQTETEIIILSPAWAHCISYLREMTKQDRLVCQGCRQSVRVRAGRVRRPHFAHKHLAGCSYGTETPEILEARAVLYGWLVKQFSDGVTLEHKLEGSDLPRAVDCWVERPSGALAYWIIDARMKLEGRENIQAALAQSGITVTWVLVSQLLQAHPSHEGKIYLSPTERDLLVTSEYDMIGAERHTRLPGSQGQTLHYLDFRTGTLITYRSLVLFHAPNIFTGRCEENPLELVRIDPQTGEFVHPGEYEQLQHTRQELARIDAAQRQAEQRAAAWFSQSAQIPKHESLAQTIDGKDTSRPQMATPGDAGYVDRSKEYVCVLCGQITANWWTSFVEGGVRKCKCRDCLKKGVR